MLQGGAADQDLRWTVDQSERQKEGNEPHLILNRVYAEIAMNTSTGLGRRANYLSL